MLEMKAKLRNIKLKSHFDLDIPKTFITESTRVKQIIMNLIGNAIKFTFKGFVKVTVKLLHKDNKEIIQIEVEDSGIGIK